MKRGDVVAVCYDGKWSRRVRGEVLATRRGHHIQVSFPQYADDGTLVHWFRRQRRPRRYGGKPFYFAGFVPVEGSLMQAMFGCTGDYYAVYPWKETK